MRLLLREIVEKQANEQHLELGTWMIEADPENGLLREAGRFVGGHERNRFDPIRRRLWLRICRRHLPKIKPGALDIFADRFLSTLGKTPDQDILPARRDDCAQKKEERSSPS